MTDLSTRSTVNNTAYTAILPVGSGGIVQPQSSGRVLIVVADSQPAPTAEGTYSASETNPFVIGSSLMPATGQIWAMAENSSEMFVTKMVV